MKHSHSRRFFMKTGVLSVATLLAAPLLKIQSAFSAHVNEAEPLVSSMGYIKDVNDVNNVQFAKSLKDRKDKKDMKSQCNNCQFFLGEAGAEMAKCKLIPSGEVYATGWCRSYSKKQKKNS